MRKALLLFLMTIPAFDTQASWGSSCGPGQGLRPILTTYIPSAPPVQEVGYRWQKLDEEQQALYYHGKQIGAMWVKGLKAGKYFSFDKGIWTEAVSPISNPDYRPEMKHAEENFGLDKTKIHQPTPNTISGKACTKEEALKSIYGAQVPDDGKKLRLTLIGPKADCDQVLNDLKASKDFEKLKDLWLIQEYRPDEWAVQSGFKKDGKPTIYLQTAEGKVLHRQDDYQGGVTQLVEAIRKADPLYDASKDPNVLQPPSNGLPGPLKDIPLPILLLGGGAVLLLIFNRKETANG